MAPYSWYRGSSTRFLRISSQCTWSSKAHTTWTYTGSPIAPDVVAHDTNDAPASLITALPRVSNDLEVLLDPLGLDLDGVDEVHRSQSPSPRTQASPPWRWREVVGGLPRPGEVPERGVEDPPGSLR